MRIYMLETHSSTADGFRVRRFEVGSVYDIEEPIAKYFIQKGFAIPAPNLSKSDYPIYHMPGAPVIFL